MMSASRELIMPVLGALESSINALLALDPDTLKNMRDLQGKVIALEVLAAPSTPLLTLYMLPGAGGIEILSQYGGEADTTLSGTAMALARMSLGSRLGGPDASEVLFAGEVVIRGDIELGQRFKRLLDRLDIDWEEHLSHLTGDIVAHKVGSFFRSAQQWFRQSAKTLGTDAAEYLQMEGEILPEQAEVAEFLQQVDETRDDVERLQARIQRVATNLQQNCDKDR